MQNARPDPVCSYKDKFHDDDKLAMASAYLDGRYTMAEIAAEFGVHYSTVSRAVAKCKT
ncbi:helix-turn-helix domain-containing protein [Pseudoalteromonas phenolica]|uniref:helix-turn-helix domain-containing protein n=1 Tax=Pseudoalteromonas phenolica TaxID=161398 RepID=UPI0032D595B3